MTPQEEATSTANARSTHYMDAVRDMRSAFRFGSFVDKGVHAIPDGQSVMLFESQGQPTRTAIFDVSPRRFRDDVNVVDMARADCRRVDGSLASCGGEAA